MDWGPCAGRALGAELLKWSPTLSLNGGDLRAEDGDPEQPHTEETGKQPAEPDCPLPQNGALLLWGLLEQNS